jgi:hypothetical protein
MNVQEVRMLLVEAQECEILMLQRAGIATASAELLLARMRAKVDDLCRAPEDHDSAI